MTDYLTTEAVIAALEDLIERIGEAPGDYWALEAYDRARLDAQAQADRHTLRLVVARLRAQGAPQSAGEEIELVRGALPNTSNKAGAQGARLNAPTDLVTDEQFQRLRLFLCGGPGLAIKIDINEAPLLWDVQQFFFRLSAMVEAASSTLSPPRPDPQEKV